MEQQVFGQLSPEVEINNWNGCLQIKHYDPSTLEQRVLALTAPHAVSLWVQLLN